VHLGLILPNFGEGSTPEGIRRMAEAAEELGLEVRGRELGLSELGQDLAQLAGELAFA
jgi:hypothetical protein